MKNTSPAPQAIALVSGGMDSLVTLALALKENSQVAVFHLNYGQKTQKKEEESFRSIADFYKIPLPLRKTLDLSFLKDIGGSSLTDQKINVKKYQENLAQSFGSYAQDIPDSYVPFRNTIILSLAVAWAEVLGATRLYIGAVEEDSSGYPDCREDYYKAFNQLIKVGTKEGRPEIRTPVIHMRKKDIVAKALELKAPLHLSWSCYQSEDFACGECDSCALRLRGFKEAGARDPLPYKTIPEQWR